MGGREKRTGPPRRKLECEVRADIRDKKKSRGGGGVGLQPSLEGRRICGGGACSIAWVCYYLPYLSYCCDKMSQRKALRKEGYIPVPSLRVQSAAVGKCGGSSLRQPISVGIHNQEAKTTDEARFARSFLLSFRH